MRRISMLLVLSTLFLIFTGCGGGGSKKSSDPPKSEKSIKADHSTLNIAAISKTELDAARALRMSLDHASVGGNILNGMNRLRDSNGERYSFSNWHWRNRGNDPGGDGKVDTFVEWVHNQYAQYDVFQMKYCYIDQDASFTYYRDAMLTLESTYPNKKFIWWTIPLMTEGDDNSLREAFNNQIRSYCSVNNKPLFDIADIESHDASGNPVTNGGFEALASEWASDNGHLNNNGGDRMARAMWWIMTQLAKE